MTGDRVRKKKLSEEVETRLEKDIADGVMKVGTALPSERELMARFGVGRPSVREALFSLQKKGLVSLAGGSRARVTLPDITSILRDLSTAARLYLGHPDGLRSLHELRTMIEASLARNAARQATPADLRRLEERLLANRAAIGSREEFERTDNEFHYELVKIAGNSLLVQLHEILVGWLQDQRDIVLEFPEIDRIAYEHHESIYKSILEHRPDLAEDAVRASLQTVDRAYWAALARKETSSNPRLSKAKGRSGSAQEQSR